MSASIVVRFGGNLDDLKKALAGVGAAIEESGKAFERLAERLQGKRAISEAEKWAQAIEKIGGATKLTARDAEQANRVFEKAITYYRAAGKEGPEHFQRLAAATKQVALEAQNAERTFSGFGTSLSSAFQSPQAALVSFGQRLAAQTGVADRLGAAFGVTGAEAVALGGAVAGVGVVFAAAAGAEVALAKGLWDCATAAAAVGDELHDTALKTGISAEKLSELRFAAKVVGVDLRDISNASFQMNRRMAEDSAVFERGLKAIGLSMIELQRIPLDERLLAVSDAMRATEDQTKISLAAFGLWGRAGREMLPLVLEPLRELTEESRRLGFTWTETDVKAAHQFKEELNLIAAAIEQVKVKIGMGLIPGLMILAKVAESAKSGDWSDIPKLSKALEAVFFGAGPLASAQNFFRLAGAMADARDKAGQVAMALGALGPARADVNLLSDAQMAAAVAADALKDAQQRLDPAVAKAALAMFDAGKNAAQVKEAFHDAGLVMEPTEAALEALHKAWQTGQEQAKKYAEALRQLSGVLTPLTEQQRTLADLLSQRGLTPPQIAAFPEMKGLSETAIKGYLDGLKASRAEATAYLTLLEHIHAVTQQLAATQEKAAAKQREQVAAVSQQDLARQVVMAGQLADKLAQVQEVGVTRQIHDLERLRAREKAQLGERTAQNAAWWDWNNALVDQAIDYQIGRLFDEVGAAKADYEAIAASGVDSVADLRDAWDRYWTEEERHRHDDLADWLRALSTLEAGFQALAQVGSESFRAINTAAAALFRTFRALGDGIDSVRKGFAQFKAGDWLRGFESLASGIMGVVDAAVSLGKALVDLFGHHTEHDISRKLSEWGLAGASDTLVQKIADDVKKLGGEVESSLFHLADIISEAGGVTATNYRTFLSKLHDVFSMVELGKFNVTKAKQVLDETFGQFLAYATEAAKKTGGILDRQLREIVRLDKVFGTGSTEIAKFVESQLTSALGGLTQFLQLNTTATDTLKQQQTELADLQQQLAQATTAEQRAELQKRIADLRAAMATQEAIAKGTVITSQAAAEGMGAALAGMLAEMTSRGVPLVEMLKQLEPAVTALEQQLEATGFSGGAAFDQLRGQLALMKDSVTGPLLQGIQGIGQGLVGLFNANVLSPDMWTGMIQQISAMWTQMGDKGHDALALMQPQLQAIWEIQQDTGWAVDATTQAMLDEAQAAGLVGEKHKSAQRQMIDGINKLNDGIAALIKGFGFELPESMKGTEDGLGRVKKTAGDLVPPDVTPDIDVEATQAAAEEVQRKLDQIRAPKVIVDVEWPPGTPGEPPGRGGGGGRGGAMHTGGIVPEAITWRPWPAYHAGGLIPQEWPQLAVRAHVGLAPDEYPVILQSGEGVLSRQGMETLGASYIRAWNRGEVTAAPTELAVASRTGREQPLEITVVSKLDGRTLAKELISIVKRLGGA